jgi:phosphoglycerate dehydrogenase-like enzyme
MRILFCSESFAAASKTLARRLSRGDEVAVCPRDRIQSALDGVSVVIPLMCRIDAPVMDAGNFRLIQQWGAGLEGVDFMAARQRGIRVANVPATGNNADSVAEHAILLMLALLRTLPAAEANVRAGVLGIPQGRMLASRTVCLYGLGSIARALVHRLRPFGVRLVGVTRDPNAPKATELNLDACYPAPELHAALAQSDILVLCSRLVPETHGVIDAAALRALPPGACLVNAARGGLVNYGALFEALAEGRLAGAGLDVYWQEPVAPDDPLLALPNVIATPHIAGVTDRSYEEIADAVWINIERLRRNEPLLNCVV